VNGVDKEKVKAFAARILKEVGSVNILETKEDGLYLNGVRLDCVTRLDVNNISPDGEMEAVIHIDIHEANIKHKVT
jgi:hypothetical protein